MQLITSQNFNIQTCFRKLLWFFSFKCWFKDQMISRTHLSMPNAYKLCVLIEMSTEIGMLKFLRCDYLLVQWCMKLTLVWEILHFMLRAGVFHEYLIFVGINKNMRFVQYNNACGVDVFYELQLFICLWLYGYNYVCTIRSKYTLHNMISNYSIVKDSNADLTVENWNFKICP